VKTDLSRLFVPSRNNLAFFSQIEFASLIMEKAEEAANSQMLPENNEVGN
jgi:hypothetical protein